MIEYFMLLAASAIVLLVMLAMGWGDRWRLAGVVRRWTDGNPERRRENAERTMRAIVENDLLGSDRQLALLAGRLYDLEERVARLEDPYGKRKRGRGIYAEPFQGVPGLKALEDYLTTTDDAPAQIGGDGGIVHSYILSDDGELQAGKD